MMIDVADGNTVYYYHFDGLGSVVALSDTSANVVERYSYDVFGEPNKVSDVNNPYLFTGRRYDPETGNYYYRARCYDPNIGRFFQTDPIGYEGGLNLYTYVGNNPINFTDPSGAFCCDTEALIDCLVRPFDLPPTIPIAAACIVSCKICWKAPGIWNPACWVCGGCIGATIAYIVYCVSSHCSW